MGKLLSFMSREINIFLWVKYNFHFASSSWRNTLGQNKNVMTCESDKSHPSNSSSSLVSSKRSSAWEVISVTTGDLINSWAWRIFLGSPLVNLWMTDHVRVSGAIGSCLIIALHDLGSSWEVNKCCNEATCTLHYLSLHLLIITN